VSAAENGKRKRRFNYTVMIFADSKEGRIRQLRIDPVVVESLFVILFAVITVLGVVNSRRGGEIMALTSEKEQHVEQIRALEQENKSLEQENKSLEQENKSLTLLSDELTEKVTILSDTVNQKVEEEEAEEAADAQAHMPAGFPMTSSASIREADTEDPMVKLTGSEGNSIVASGAGTVLSITTGSSYLHCVKIDHGNGYVSIYYNDGEVMLREGDEVVRGSILYVIGEENTELGYQITCDEKYIEPMELLNVDG